MCKQNKNINDIDLNTIIFCFEFSFHGNIPLGSASKRIYFMKFCDISLCEFTKKYSYFTKSVLLFRKGISLFHENISLFCEKISRYFVNDIHCEIIKIFITYTI